MESNICWKQNKEDMDYDVEVESINMTAYIDHCLRQKMLTREEYCFLKKIFKLKPTSRVYNVFYAKHNSLHSVWKLIKYKLNQFRIYKKLSQKKMLEACGTMPKKRKRLERNAIRMH